MEVIERIVLETCNDKDAAEELNASEVNKFMEEVSDASTVDEVGIYMKNIEINQTMKKRKSRDICLRKSLEL